MNRDRLATARAAATVARGKNRGKLKQTCPTPGSDGAAMWQALMMQANPHKVSPKTMLVNSMADHHFYNDCCIFARLVAARIDMKQLDTDRLVLEKLDVW